MTLDVRWGYNNIHIREGDEEKAVFHTNRGLFEPTVMFFGLTNSPVTFQWMMNNIFVNLIGEGKVTIYLDDILIFSKDLHEHQQIIKRVLHRLQENKLFLKAEKCEFEVLEMEYLRVIISENFIRMDPVKIAGIVEWLTPKKKKELQLFLGFTNFYQKFIKMYSRVICLLTQLTANTEWMWGEAQEKAFQELKRCMAEDIILAIPTDTDPFQVEADASKGAVGAVLSQKQKGVWRPVAFMSKALSTMERNYKIYNKELLAIMLALSEWCHYLMGTVENMEIWSDHQTALAVKIIYARQSIDRPADKSRQSIDWSPQYSAGPRHGCWGVSQLITALPHTCWDTATHPLLVTADVHPSAQWGTIFPFLESGPNDLILMGYFCDIISGVAGRVPATHQFSHRPTH